MFKKESDLQKLVLAWLKVQPGYFSWRSYVGPIIRGNKKFSPNPMAGFPDIFGFDAGNRPFAIELKSQTGIVSDKQNIWMVDLEKKGVYCIVAKDLDWIINELKILKSYPARNNFSLCKSKSSMPL